MLAVFCFFFVSTRINLPTECHLCSGSIHVAANSLQDDVPYFDISDESDDNDDIFFEKEEKNEKSDAIHESWTGRHTPAALNIVIDLLYNKKFVSPGMPPFYIFYKQMKAYTA